MGDSKVNQELISGLDQFKIGQRLAETLFDAGKKYILASDTEKALLAYASGIYYSHEPGQMKAALEQISNSDSQNSASACVRELLLLGLASRFFDPVSYAAINEFATKEAKKLHRAVAVIIDSDISAQIYPNQTEKQAITSAFKNYFGSLIGGDSETTDGKINEGIQKAYPRRVLALSYHAMESSSDTLIQKSYSKYREPRSVKQLPFNCYEPLQYWSDILISDVKAANVKVMGISSAPSAIIEYIVAIALGANVLIDRALRDKIIAYTADPLYSLLDKIIFYLDDQYLLNTFIGTGLPKVSSPMREKIARALHETYRVSGSPFRSKISMSEWDDLSPELKKSNLEAYDNVMQKFYEIGYVMEMAKGAESKPIELSINEVETLAKMEHSRWSLERLINGWLYGNEKNYEKRTDPSLKPWAELDDEIRDIDRMLVRKLPAFLSHFEINLRKI
jgi:hypothetical protein